MFYFHWQYWDNQSQVPHFHHDVTKKYAKMNFRIVIYFNCRKMADGKFERKYQQFFWLELCNAGNQIFQILLLHFDSFV